MIKVKTSMARATAATKRAHKTDGTKFVTPDQIGQRWAMHKESIRRMIRQNRMASIVISRRRLIPVSEVERIEAEGLIARNS